MIKKIFLSACLVQMFGCSSSPESEVVLPNVDLNVAQTTPSGLFPVPSHSPENFHSNWQARPHSHHASRQVLTNYVSRLAKDLISNLNQQYIYPIAVTSFVNLSSDLQTTNLAGNQIAEEMLTELRKLGLPVIDFKTTGNIQVTPEGDFVFSRTVGELKSTQGINNVLSGTMVWHETGLVINARIISLNDNSVLSAARLSIPYFVTDSIFAGPEQHRFTGYSKH
ncbi:hypothetical protein C2869_06075 [Saccharobesus litoralis]|uniref:FlgO domain-containing protein n=1 Tax=Saccharobesus litoralis TaxID=2172099 RepID=A0A2S0VPB7_9ALTE|nr:FlgO family outer membrane protein [Saccharobesus litoralis]AWB66032.1 hypothetical protein C2869_06075 [Saccharobesus litoralis]